MWKEEGERGGGHASLQSSNQPASQPASQPVSQTASQSDSQADWYTLHKFCLEAAQLRVPAPLEQKCGTVHMASSNFDLSAVESVRLRCETISQ